MTRVFSEERGLAGTVLIILVAWALAAVLMLTGTLIAAQQIDDRVAFITGQVSAIDEDLDSVKLTQEINATAKRILEAAEPLSGQLDQVVGAAKSIDDTVVKILDTAQSINSTVKEINTTAGGINASVLGIGSDVDSIHASVLTINQSVKSILGNVNGIRANVESIDGNESVRFNLGVAGINARAALVTKVVRAIKGDLARILNEVGTRRGHRMKRGAGSNIHGHANSIDCSVVPAGAPIPLPGPGNDLVKTRGEQCGK